MHLGRKEMEKLHVLIILASIFCNAFAASIKMSKDKENNHALTPFQLLLNFLHGNRMIMGIDK